MENENKNNLILVPCDFSPLAFQATEHGALMAKAMNARLTILHVVAREAEIPAITAKLQFFVEECFESFGIRPETIVRHGEAPYSVIKEVAEEINPLRVILKTGGGIQTVKILAGTSIPFLVIQGPPNSEEIKNIVFPINFLNKLDEKMKRVVHFSDYYPNAEMHIITPSGKGTEKERNVSTAINLTSKVLKDQNIKVSYITHDKTRNTAEMILENSKNADMIVIQMEETTWLSRLFFGLREEKLVTNADAIPVLCFKKESDFR